MNDGSPSEKMAKNAETLFGEGLVHHQAGRADDAARLYRLALSLDGGHSDSLHLLGVLAFQGGRIDEACSLIGRAIAADGEVGAYHSNLAMILLAAGLTEEALAAAREAIRLSPGLPEAHNNLGNALSRRGLRLQAIDAYRHAIRLNPAYGEAHNSLGLALLAEKGRVDEAITSFQNALRLMPGSADAAGNLASALHAAGRDAEALGHAQRATARQPDDAELQNILGAVLVATGQTEKALAAFRKAVALKPGSPAALRNLADTLARLGRRHEAASVFAQSLAALPEDPEALSNLGTLLMRDGRLDEARPCYRNALILAPGLAWAHYNLANLETERGRLAEAIRLQGRALAIDPDFAEAHLNRGMAHLLSGALEPGWRDYAWRWMVKDAQALRPDRFSEPLWGGEAGEGGHILLWAEQGAGDALQFIRYAPEVASRGWQVRVRAPKSLLRLFSSMPAIELVAEDADPGSFDVHCPLLNLPGVLGTGLSEIPDAVPYLAVDPDLAARWRTRLPVGFRLGVAWRGSPIHRRDRMRSMSAELFEKFLKIKGLTTVSLQKDATAAECRRLGLMTTELGDYADTAALVSCLDLVISVDSSVCHLAGALGAPVWTLLDAAPDWRWLQDRDDSPWYPTMRLFRQATAGDWTPVLAEVRASLQQMVQPATWWRRLLP